MEMPWMTQQMACASALAFWLIMILLVIGPMLEYVRSDSSLLVIGIFMVSITVITLLCLCGTFTLFEVILFEGI